MSTGNIQREPKKNSALPKEEKLTGQIYFRTGIKPEIWLSAFVPILVLIVELDTIKKTREATGTVRYSRKLLAAKLELDENMPFGLQLWKSGKLTAQQANYIDAKLFEGKSVRLKFAFEGKGENVTQMFSSLRRAGLVTGPVLFCGGGGQFLAELQTDRLLPLIKAISQDEETGATLTLLDGRPITF